MQREKKKKDGGQSQGNAASRYQGWELHFTSSGLYTLVVCNRCNSISRVSGDWEVPDGDAERTGIGEPSYVIAFSEEKSLETLRGRQGRGKL